MKKFLIFSLFILPTFLFSQNWNQLGFNIEGVISGESSGEVVCLSNDGNTVAISSPGDGQSINQGGSVSVYKFNGSSWNQLGSDILGDFIHSYAGTSIALNGNGTKLVIGFPGENYLQAIAVSVQNIGLVRVYELIANTWVQLGGDISNGEIDDHFGHSVSMNNDGNIIAIGAKNGSVDSQVISRVGYVKLFSWDGNVWNQLGSNINGIFNPSIGLQDLGFGMGVELNSDGDILAVSTRYASGLFCCTNGSQGAVRVYMFDGIDWSQLGNELTGSSLEDDHFGMGRAWNGSSLSFNCDGSILAVGANQASSGSDYGYVNVYKFDGSIWNLLGNTITPNLNGITPNPTWSHFGSAVSLNKDGNIIAIGMPIANTLSSGSVSGAVQAFSFDSSSWTQFGSTIYGSYWSGTGMSISLSSDGKTLAVGAPYVNITLPSGIIANGAGQVSVYTTKSYNCDPIQGCVSIDGFSGQFASLYECIINCPSTIIPEHSCDPPITYNCTVNGCEDPGDGTGTFLNILDCENMCSCDTYDSWPITDPDPYVNPNQNTWCEWCVDYANNGFVAFNPAGITWGSPDVMCDCCTSTDLNEINPSSIKQLIKVVDILGREILNETENKILFFIYNDGTVEKRIKF